MSIFTAFSSGFVISNSATDKFLSYLKPKEPTFDYIVENKRSQEISIAVKSNKSFKDLNIDGISRTRIENIYLIHSDTVNFYYDINSNSVINGTIYNASNGETKKNLQLELLELNSKLKQKGKQTNSIQNEGGFIPEDKSQDIKEKDTLINEKDNNEKINKKYLKLLNSTTDIDNYKLNERVNPSLINRYRASIEYKGRKYTKIGYDKDGSKLSPDVTQTQIKKLINNTISAGDSWSIAYKAENEKDSIVVFTDPTCPFCKKLHLDIDKLNNAGISVYYLFYPRTVLRGLKDPQLHKTINLMDDAWYSKNKKMALDDIFDGYKVREENKTKNTNIPNPVFEHYLLGELVGVTGTPTILMSNGKVETGYRNTKRLLSTISMRP